MLQDTPDYFIMNFPNTKDFSKLESEKEMILAKKAKEKKCVFCGKPFTPLQGKGGPRKYCYRRECEEARENVRRKKNRDRYVKK
jgi:hypothetical protein